MAETLSNPHDRFFRQALSRQDVATDFLRHYLPPEAAALVNTGSDTMTEADLRQSMEKHWPEGVTVMSTIAEGWVEQGMQKGLSQGLSQGLNQGLNQGRREGLLDAIQLGLRLRFGSEGMRLMPEIYGIQDLAILRTIYSSIETAKSPDDLRRIYA